MSSNIRNKYFHIVINFTSLYLRPI